MSIKVDEDTNKGCTFQWKIENVSLCWWLRKGQKLESPIFNVAEDTKWSLQLYPKGFSDEQNISFFLLRKEDCCGPDTVEVNFQLAFLHEGGLYSKETLTSKVFRKGGNLGSFNFVTRERVFVTESESFLPDDSLNIQCTIFTIDKKTVKTRHIFASTHIKVKRKSYEWRINKISTLKSGMKNEFIHHLFGLSLVLNKHSDKLVHMFSSHDCVNYLSCNTSIIDSEGRKKRCAIQKYFPVALKKRVLSYTALLPKMSMKNNSKYFPNDVLSFEFECVLSTVEHFVGRKYFAKLENDVVKEKSQNIPVLFEDFKSLNNDGIFSDTELRTLTKTFPAHKGILSVRSPVFMKMFSNEMKEKISGHVDITDFEDDTIHRMLLYIYTDTLESLQFESASKLYEIADKYQILSLKSRCSSFLKENLCSTNACDAFVLADLHSDDDLRNAVEDYLLSQSESFFDSQEWKDFMNTHIKAAADIMCKKITNSKLHLLS